MVWKVLNLCCITFCRGWLQNMCISFISGDFAAFGVHQVCGLEFVGGLIAICDGFIVVVTHSFLRT